MVIRWDFRVEAVSEKGTERVWVNMGFLVYSLMFVSFKVRGLRRYFLFIFFKGRRHVSTSYTTLILEHAYLNTQ